MNSTFSRPAAEVADAPVPLGTMDIKDILYFEHERTATNNYVVRFFYCVKFSRQEPMLKISENVPFLWNLRLKVNGK
jgi:hypothetical protein